jgi:hypothetical protein
MSLNGIQQFQYTTNMFLYFNKKFGSSDESYNVASNAAYYQIYVAYVSFIFLSFILLYYNHIPVNNGWSTIKGRHTKV